MKMAFLSLKAISKHSVPKLAFVILINTLIIAAVSMADFLHLKKVTLMRTTTATLRRLTSARRSPCTIYSLLTHRRERVRRSRKIISQPSLLAFEHFKMEVIA